MSQVTVSLASRPLSSSPLYLALALALVSLSLTVSFHALAFALCSWTRFSMYPSLPQTLCLSLCLSFLSISFLFYLLPLLSPSSLSFSLSLSLSLSLSGAEAEAGSWRALHAPKSKHAQPIRSPKKQPKHRTHPPRQKLSKLEKGSAKPRQVSST